MTRRADDGSPAGDPLVFGFHPVRELLRSRPHAVEAVLCAVRQGKRHGEIAGHCARHRIALREVDDATLRQYAGKGARHNGFAAVMRPGAERSRPDGAPAGEDGDIRADPTMRVLVEDVQDPRNLGALLRVCEGAGVGEVVIRDRGAAPITPTVVKASAGATAWLPIRRAPNSARIIEQHKEEGYWVYGAAAGGAPPWSYDLTGPVLLCFGGEAEGLRARTRSLCDGLIGLPMRGRVDALNLATAVAAVLYDAVRQRGLAPAEQDG
ncbi:MAG: RNA methyltransferase [Acidobacteriota bacterium]